jgi:glycosyltransferase involved in cell wall biosynthesis
VTLTTTATTSPAVRRTRSGAAHLSTTPRLPPSERLRIGILAPPWFAVPPQRYGGIEAVVALLADGLSLRGHDVTLFASGGSATRARLRSRFRVPPSELLGKTEPELEHALLAVEHRQSLDVLSEHSGPLGIVTAGLAGLPTLHTVHGTLTGGNAGPYERALDAVPSTRLASLTFAQRRPAPHLPWAANLPNAIDVDRHVFVPDARRRYVAWLGRMCDDKGPDRAIVAARRAGLPIVLAGKMQAPEERAYFKEHVEPLLADDAVYLGEIDADGRNALFAEALVLVAPLAWEEPFGLAMIEAMACGVPVVATRRGSVPEVVEPGRSGLIVDADEEFPEAIRRAARLDRRECRAAAVERFSPRMLVNRYEQALAVAVGARVSETSALLTG